MAHLSSWKENRLIFLLLWPVILESWSRASSRFNDHCDSKGQPVGNAESVTEVHLGKRFPFFIKSLINWFSIIWWACIENCVKYYIWQQFSDWTPPRIAKGARTCNLLHQNFLSLLSWLQWYSVIFYCSVFIRTYIRIRSPRCVASCPIQ